jgi:hypothetical protein
MAKKACLLHRDVMAGHELTLVEDDNNVAAMEMRGSLPAPEASILEFGYPRIAQHATRSRFWTMIKQSMLSNNTQPMDIFPKAWQRWC